MIIPFPGAPLRDIEGRPRKHGLDAPIVRARDISLVLTFDGMSRWSWRCIARRE